MNDKHEHKRDHEPDVYGHRREEDLSIPNWIKWFATFLNRVGFPIFAFCVLAYFYFVGLQKNTAIIGELRDVMLAVKISIDNQR